MDFNGMTKNRGRKKNCSNSHNNNKKKRSDSAMKVVYISSPMKVKTSAAKFRTIVQKLTGRDSDISDYMIDGGARINPTPDFEILPETFNYIGSSSDQQNNSSSRESPTSSDSQLEQGTATTSSCSFPLGDYLFMNSNSNSNSNYNDEIGSEEQFFPSNLFGDSNYYLDMDVLGSYDAL